MIKRALLLSTLLTINVTGAQKKPVIHKPMVQSELVASVLIAEAGGEGKAGMCAVFEVIKNRSKIRNISLTKVVTQKYAFSCLNRYRTNQQTFINKNKRHPMFGFALWVVTSYQGNITKGANFYHEKTKHPDWSQGVAPVVVVGNHKFFALVGHY